MPAIDAETRNLIDGQLVPASNGGSFDNINPATEEVIGTAADGTKDDMENAIAAARRAFDETDWSTNHPFRKHCLEQLNAALAEAREDLRQIVVAEAGSPILITYQVQVDSYIDSMPYWSNLAASYEYETPMSDIEFMGNPQGRLMRREAVGVVGAITPWNFPLYLNLAKIGPALAAGNTLVLKPAPDTPWSATHLGRLVAEKTDIPPGVLNIVASSDHALGAMLSRDPRVDLVTFTGSRPPGGQSWKPRQARSRKPSSNSVASLRRSSSTTSTWTLRRPCPESPYAPMRARAAPSRPVPCFPAPGTKRVSRRSRPPWRASPTAIPWTQAISWVRL